MAFPRLNALSYWLFLVRRARHLPELLRQQRRGPGGLDVATPRSRRSTRRARGQDLWILGAAHPRRSASLVGAINLVVTIHNMRAPGMSWMRIPLFVWAMVTYAWLLIIVLPSLSAGLTLMLLDRHAGTHFFDPAHGGSPLLYQHVFWFFGHPEVYVMILPAMGIISEIIPVFARKPIFGYKAVALSTVGIAFYSLLVWGHHMFAVGLPLGLDIFFMISSMIIAIPTGVKIFNWLATLVARQHLVRHADAVGARVHRRLHDRRPVRDPPRRVPGRLGSDRHASSSSRTCTTCSSAARSSRSSAASTTGGRRCSAACSTSGSGSCTSGSSSSASTSRSSRCTCSGCWGCRAASTPTSPAACGRSTT